MKWGFSQRLLLYLFVQTSQHLFSLIVCLKEQFGNFKMLKKLIATLLVLVSVASVIDACTVPKTKPDFDVTKVKVKNIYISIILCFK
jgi:hypothetical protein